MLDEIKEAYVQCANIIPNWKKKTKNELCFEYIEHENSSIAECYLAAIIVKYWNKINLLYHKSRPAATYEDCYEWVVESILYALKHRKWLDETSSIYQDPTGPDKVINRNSECRRLTFFQQLFRYNKMIAVNTLSINIFTNEDENTGDGYDKFMDETAEINTNEMSVFNYIRTAFQNKEYVLAFVLDGIISCKNPADDFDAFVRQLANLLIKMPDAYAYVFAREYGLPLEDIKNSLTYTKNIDIKKLCDMITLMMKRLKYDKEMRCICIG